MPIVFQRSAGSASPLRRDARSRKPLSRGPFAAALRRTGDRRASRPPWAEAEGEAARRTTLDEFARRAAADAEARTAPALEVGMGAGPYRSMFPSERYEAIAIQPTPAPGGSYPGFVPFRPIDNLPADDGVFGVTLCIGVLERTPEPQGLMAELGRTLATGGQLFLAAPLIVPEPSRARLDSRRRFGLNYLLEAAGFTIEDLMPIERESAYGVVASKRRPTGAGRRKGDRLATGSTSTSTTAAD